MRIPTNICHLPEASPFSLVTIFNFKVPKAPKVSRQYKPLMCQSFKSAKVPVVLKIL